MIEKSENTVKITIADGSIAKLLIFRESDFVIDLPIPNGQDFAEISGLIEGNYKVVHTNKLLTNFITEDFEVK